MYGLNPEIPAGFIDLEYSASLQSSESPEQIAELHDSVLRHSPVIDVLTRRLRIDGNYSHHRPARCPGNPERPTRLSMCCSCYA